MSMWNPGQNEDHEHAIFIVVILVVVLIVLVVSASWEPTRMLR
jgi:hypothetical protein